MAKKALFITSNAGVARDELLEPLEFLRSKGIEIGRDVWLGAHVGVKEEMAAVDCIQSFSNKHIINSTFTKSLKN